MKLPEEDIKELAEFYDGFANALDPFSDERECAKHAFFQKLRELRSKFAPECEFSTFKKHALRCCKIRLNPKAKRRMGG